VNSVTPAAGHSYDGRHTSQKTWNADACRPRVRARAHWTPGRIGDGIIPKGEAHPMSKPESASLRVGDQAPLFTLPNQKGVPVSLETALAKGPVLLGFHRGTW